MLRYDKEKHKFITNNNAYNCKDDIDMSILASKINNRLKIIESIKNPSITWNDIVDSTDWVEDDLVNAPIFACTWAGDIFGFDILGADNKSIYLVRNGYYRSGI